MNIADINAETRSLCDADSTSYPDATLLRRVNNAYERVVGKIIATDGNWEFDDTNFTKHPIGEATLTAGQSDYAFDGTFLDILSVSVRDVTGIWHQLHPLDKTQFNQDPDEFLKTDGMPRFYDKIDNSIFLYPAPAEANVYQSGENLKAYFQRTADLFTSGQVTTGTKEPGFMSTYHEILCYMAAIPYCMSYKKDRVPLFEKRVTEIEEDMLNRYAKRAKDEKTQIIPRYYSSV